MILTVKAFREILILVLFAFKGKVEAGEEEKERKISRDLLKAEIAVEDAVVQTDRTNINKSPELKLTQG